MSTQTWNCAMCTFENGVLDVQCIMCETPAPAAAANVPVESAAESPALNASTSPAVVRITAEPSAEPQWFQSWDEGRRMFFYFNRATQESVWEPPQGFPFVPHVGPTPGKVSAPQSSREAGRGPSPAVRNFSRFESPAEPAAAAAPPVVDVEPVTVAPASTPASAAPTPAAAAPTPAAAAAPVVQPGAGQQLLRSTLAEQARSSGITQNLHPESFPEFVGVGSAAAASIDDLDLWNMDDDTNAAFSSPRGSFSSMGSMPIESVLTPQQRWKKALRKIQVVRAFGGRPGDANASISLPPEVERKRLVARQELLTTEREYFNRVNGLVDGFMRPLLQFVDAEALAQKDGGGGMVSHQNNGGSGASAAVAVTQETCAMARRVFGNLEQIRNLTKTLLDDLAEAIATPDGKIGPVFCKIAPYLRIYLAYYHNFDASRLALDQLRQAPWAHGFISACEAQPACKGRTLRDFLIEPVQRVPRYEMLIKEILKYTPPEHPNNGPLLEALRLVKQVADGMNLELGAMDARLKVATLSVAWAGVDFTAPHRFFLKEGAVLKTDRHGLRKQVHFLLFNDLVAFGSKIDDSAVFKAFGFRSSNTGSAPSSAAAASSSDRFSIRFKAPLLECLVIDDLAVYGKEGRLKLREDTPMASAMMEAASKCGGDVQRLAHALELTNGGASAEEQQETTRGWALLKECGADFNRILESQLDPNSFMIQVSDQKTLFLTCCSPGERKAWVAALASAIQKCLATEHLSRDGTKHRAVTGGGASQTIDEASPRVGFGKGGRRPSGNLGSGSGKPNSNSDMGSEVVANKSVISKLSSQFRSLQSKHSSEMDN